MAELLDPSVIVTEAPITSQGAYKRAVNMYLSATRDIFQGEFERLQRNNRIPLVTVAMKTETGIKRIDHPLLKIPGRLDPGEVVVLTEHGELYAVQRSQMSGESLDGSEARPLLPEEVMAFAPTVLQQIEKLKQVPQVFQNSRA